MQAAFATVLWIVCGSAIVIAFVALALSGKTWEEYGKNALLMDGDSPREAKQGSAAALLERDDEIRQLLEARNHRRERRGETPIDIESELRRLTTPQIDSDLRQEIRDMVIARNHRRARTGKPALDVETEIEREIADLHGVI